MTQQHYKGNKQLYASKFTEENTNEMQNEFSQMMEDINKQIMKLNEVPQILYNHGYMCAPQCYWHQRVEKVTYRIRSSDGQRVNEKKRIPSTALPDGIHPSYDVGLRWYFAMHQNLKRLVERMPPFVDPKKEKYIVKESVPLDIAPSFS